MANTTYYSKSVGSVESIFFVAKENIGGGQQKIAVYEVEDLSKMMNVLRYTEVHQVNVEQIGFLIELLNEMTEAGGTLSKIVTDTKDIDECLMSLQPVKAIVENTASNNVFQCPYCPSEFENHMTLQILKLHVKKVHRISCVEDFMCPKCMQTIFESPETTDKDMESGIKETLDHNMLNQVFEPMNMEVAGEEVVEQPLVVMMRDESREVVQVVVDEDAKAIISYENVREYSCNLCNYQSSHKTHVKNHIRWVHQKIKDKYCPHCEFKCYQNGHLRSHIKRVHQKIKDFVCSYSECKYKTSSKQDLRKHIRTVHEKLKINQPKSFACMQCAFRTVTKNALELHIKTVHDNIKDYSCPHCEQCFGQKGARDKHIKAVHEKIKDHACVQCDYRTSYKNILDRHIRAVHEKLKNVECPECAVQFFDNNGLTKHLKAVHQKIKDIQCHLCNYHCSQTQHIKRHMKTVHGKD